MDIFAIVQVDTETKLNQIKTHLIFRHKYYIKFQVETFCMKTLDLRKSRA